MDGPKTIVSTHGWGAMRASSSTRPRGWTVAVHVAGTRSGTGVSAADVSGATAQSRRGSGGGRRHCTGLSAMRPAHGPSRYSLGELAGELGTVAGHGAPLPLFALQTAKPAFVGPVRRGTGTDLRFAGTPAGIARGSRAI